MMDRYLSKEELARLTSALLVVVTGIFIFTLFAFLVVPGMRNANHPISGPAVSPPQGESGWLDLTDYPASKGYTIPPVDPKEVMAATPVLLVRGQKLFNDNCAACHGGAGRGDGPAAKGLNPGPRDFSKGAGWKNGPQIEGIWKTLNEGVKGSGMVAYEYLRRKDRMALVHYVQSLGLFDHGPEDPRKLDELAKSFAAGPEIVSDRIPVAAAMKRLEQEEAPVAALKGLDSAAPVVRWSVVDAGRAAKTLAATPGWESDGTKLAAALVRGLPGNGFAPGVACYTEADWNALREGLGDLAGKGSP